MWLTVFLMSFRTRTLEQRLMGRLGKVLSALDFFLYTREFSLVAKCSQALFPNHRSWSTFQAEWTVPIAKCHGLNQEELLHYNQLAIHGTDFIFNFFLWTYLAYTLWFRLESGLILWQYYKREWEKIFLVKRKDEGKGKKKKKQYG